MKIAREMKMMQKLHVFKINIFLITIHLFPEQNYKEQTQLFYQNCSSALHTAEIFCNIILRNYSIATCGCLKQSFSSSGSFGFCQPFD